MSRLGVVFPEDRPTAAAMAAEIAAKFSDHDVRIAGPADGPDFGKGLDAVVSLGGDGNILRTVQLVSRHDVPILGVNYGQLGYLTAIEPAEVHQSIDRVLRGDYQIERRMLLRIAVRSGGEADGMVFDALNEAVLERTAEATTTRLGVSFDDMFFTSYAADGMIVATPTGSTAYAFSARGPIVAATHRAIQITPVSPHMLFDRSLVLEPHTRVAVDVRGERPATLSVDGRTVGVLHNGDAIECTASPHSVLLVVFQPRDFHAVLKAKFGLNDR